MKPRTIFVALCMLAIAGFVFWMTTPSISKASPSGFAALGASNIKQLIYALKQYRIDNSKDLKGYPENLNTLIDQNYVTKSEFQKLTTASGLLQLDYFPPSPKSSEDQIVIVGHMKNYVLYGHLSDAVEIKKLQ